MKHNYAPVGRKDEMTISSMQQSIVYREHVRGGLTKRAFDIVVALVAILLLSPLLIGVALAVKLSDGGPALFGQTRIGAHGRTFRIWKFRSMVPDAQARLRAYLESNPEAQREWAQYRKLKNDPRITPLGRVLRKYSVDELPQIFNILLGDMSFVGPRPIDQSECALYGNSLIHYFRCRPGLTGLWQVSGRSDTSFDRRVTMDRYYAKHWSVLLDVVLIFKTIPVAITGRGSY